MKRSKQDPRKVSIRKVQSGILEFQKFGPKQVSKFESLKFKLMRSSKVFNGRSFPEKFRFEKFELILIDLDKPLAIGRLRSLPLLTLEAIRIGFCLDFRIFATSGLAIGSVCEISAG